MMLRMSPRQVLCDTIGVYTAVRKVWFFVLMISVSCFQPNRLAIKLRKAEKANEELMEEHQTELQHMALLEKQNEILTAEIIIHKEQVHVLRRGFMANSDEEGNTKTTVPRPDPRDPNRPIVLGGQYLHTYQREWKHAFQRLKDEAKDDPSVSSIRTLLFILQNCYRYCREVWKDQMAMLRALLIHPSQDPSIFQKTKTIENVIDMVDADLGDAAKHCCDIKSKGLAKVEGMQKRLWITNENSVMEEQSIVVLVIALKTAVDTVAGRQNNTINSQIDALTIEVQETKKWSHSLKRKLAFLESLLRQKGMLKPHIKAIMDEIKALRYDKREENSDRDIHSNSQSNGTSNESPRVPVKSNRRTISSRKELRQYGGISIDTPRTSVQSDEQKKGGRKELQFSDPLVVPVERGRQTTKQTRPKTQTDKSRNDKSPRPKSYNDRDTQRTKTDKEFDEKNEFEHQGNEIFPKAKSPPEKQIQATLTTSMKVEKAFKQRESEANYAWQLMDEISKDAHKTDLFRAFIRLTPPDFRTGTDHGKHLMEKYYSACKIINRIKDISISLQAANEKVEKSSTEWDQLTSTVERNLEKEQKRSKRVEDELRRTIKLLEELDEDRDSEKIHLAEIETQNKALRKENLALTEQIQSLNKRIMDASLGESLNPNRGSVLATRYREIYNNQWKMAFTTFKEKRLYESDVKIMKKLLLLLEDGYEFCKAVRTGQLDSLTTQIIYPLQGLRSKKEQTSEEVVQLTQDVMNYVTEATKLSGDLTARSLAKNFLVNHDMKVKHGKHMDFCKDYVDSCVQLCWLMHLQTPPVCFEIRGKQNDKFDEFLYDHHDKPGRYLDHVVWPPLFVNEGGHMLTKGVALAKNTT